MNVFLIFYKIRDLSCIIKEKNDEANISIFTRNNYEEALKLYPKFPNKLKLAYRFTKLMRKINKADITISDMNIYPYIHLNQTFFPNTRLIWRPTGDIWAQTESITYGKLHHPKRKVFLNLSKRLFENVSAIITVSKWLKREFQKHINNKKIFVIYKNVDTKEFNLNIDKESLRKTFGIKKDQIILLSVIQGTFFQKIKGLFYYFNVLKRLKNKFGEKIVCLICGTGPYYSYLKRYSSKLKITNLYFLGFQSKLDEIYAACDIFIHPTLLDAAPQVIREAGILEKPIVASNIGGIPEVIDAKHSFLLDPRDEDNFYLILKNLIEDKTLREEYGKKAYSFISFKNKISSGKLFWKILNRFRP